METSTTSTDIFDTSNSSLVNKNVSKTWIYILVILALFGVIYYFLSNSAEAEHMSGGTAQQMQSIDMQDVYLSGGNAGSTDQLASGNYLYFWNMSTRNGGNRANWSPIPINNNATTSQNNLVSVNVPGILSSVDNTVFPRVNPKSTVSSYPNIDNILVNQKEDIDSIRKNTSTSEKLRANALNTLQNSLTTACKSCSSKNCNNCPSCLNGNTSNPTAETNDEMTLENFDSGLTSGTIPTKVHNKINKKIIRRENFDSGLTSKTMPSSYHDKLANRLVKKNQVFASINEDDEVENFDSGVSKLSCMSSKLYNKLSNLLSKKNKKQENFDSGINSCSVPIKVHNKIVKKLNKRSEHFDELDNPLRENTNGCENCPQGRCVNCPRRTKECPDCPLGYPCNTCKTMQFLGSRDQIIDSDENENFETLSGCPCKRKVMPATNLDRKDVPEDVENFQCSLNPKSDECKTCSKCPSCRTGQCPTCSTNNNVKENFESSVGFGTLCPCGQGRCNNCPQCRAGNCTTCPKMTSNSTYIDLASLGTWHGGSRLGTNWNDATTSPVSINLNDTLTYYPDSYVGSYFINPKPDIQYPYAVIPPSRTVSGIVVDSGK